MREALKPEQIRIVTLSYLGDGWGKIIGWNHLPQEKVSVDPVLGRLAFPAAHAAPARGHVSYYYGFSAEMGGAEYDRTGRFTNGLPHLVHGPGDDPTVHSYLHALPAEG